MAAVTTRDPVEDLRRIAFLLECTLEQSYRVNAFRNAAAALTDPSPAKTWNCSPRPADCAGSRASGSARRHG